MTNTEIGRRVWVCLPGSFDKPTVLTSVFAVRALIVELGGAEDEILMTGDDSYITCEAICFDAWKVEVK